MAANTMLVHFKPLAMSSLAVNLDNAPSDLERRLLADLVNDHEDPYKTVRDRYDFLRKEVPTPLLAPDHPIITDQVIRPLREANNCFILGMFVTCISQAGLVGEMVALWRWRMLLPGFSGQELKNDLWKHLFRKQFEDLTQKDRVKILKALGDLDTSSESDFESLRTIRNQYLHRFIDPSLDTFKQAKDALILACRLVTLTLDLRPPTDGKVVISEKLRRFLKEAIDARSQEGVQEDLDS